MRHHDGSGMLIVGTRLVPGLAGQKKWEILYLQQPNSQSILRSPEDGQKVWGRNHLLMNRVPNQKASVRLLPWLGQTTPNILPAHALLCSASLQSNNTRPRAFHHGL